MNESPAILVAATLRNAVWHYLDQDLLESAAFTAERLHALELPTPFGSAPASVTTPAAAASRHLLGTVYYRLGRYQAVMDVCNKVAHIGCLYLYARCCLKLGKFSLGISALEDEKIGGKALYRSAAAEDANKDNDDDDDEGTANSPGAFGYEQRLVLPTPAMINVLLGDLYRATTGMEKRAVLSYALALRMDPLCWEASKALCELGVEVKTSALYGHFSVNMFPDPVNTTTASISIDNNNGNDSNKINNNIHSSSSSSSINNDSFNSSIHKSENHDPFSSKPKLAFAVPSSRLRHAAARQHSNDALISPTTSRLAPGATTPEPGARTLSAGGMPKAPIKRAGITSRSHLSSDNGNNSNSGNGISSHDLSAPRRSSRLAAAAATASSSAKKATSGLRFGTPPSPVKKNSLLRSATTSTLSSDRHDALRLLTSLYSTYTRSYYLFCKYACDDALNALAQLPPAQQNTPWVIAKQARIYFEKTQYHKSLEYFERLREVDPFRLQDMEYYSTLLWHLQQDVELTHLAAYLLSIDRRAPQAWCVVGNALSLNKDTDNALRCFQRATHLDPALAYAYTLQAHEHVASDSYEHAQNCYRQALRADKRHYNAWYGLGMVFLHLGNTAMAELHFRKASAINPINFVLLCCIGMVLEKSGDAERALEQYTKALTIQPSSALPLYKRARLLVKLGSYGPALADLDKLVGIAPDEASVHFLIGQIHKTLRNKTLAVREFTIALNLDPKGAHMIKEALERLEEDDYEDEASGVP